MATKQKQKILIVSQHFWPETFRVNDLCDFLLEKGCEIEVLCGIPNYPKGQYFEGYGVLKNRVQNHKGIKVHRALEIPRGGNTNSRIFINYVSFPIASVFHVPRLMAQSYDRIFVFQTSPVLMSIAAILVGKIKKIPVSMYVLDLWPENLFSVIKVKNKILRKIAQAVSHWHYRHTDRLIALSGKMRDQLLKVTGLPSEKVIVLPQVCEKLYEKDIQDVSLKKRFKNGFNILFTGTITPAQSFETVIEAAGLLKKDEAGPINWIIVGDGMSRAWLEEKIAEAGLKDTFYFEGLKPPEDIPRYTTMADLLIGCLVKSDLLEATIPAKVLSYFAAGRPMVLAMDGEVQDLVNDTVKCGYAGATGDAKQLAANIKKIYGQSAQQRQAMGRRAREYHFKHFERNMNLEKLYRFIFS